MGDERVATMQAIRDLFDKVKSDEPLPLGLARFVLRRARTLRCRNMIRDLLNSLDKFVPVLRDVVLYLLAVDKEGNKGFARDAVEHFMKDSEFRDVDYVKEWVLHLCIRAPGMFSKYSQHEKVVRWVGPALAELHAPLLAAVCNKWEVVRGYKEKVDGVSRRARRSIVLSACVLSDDEKRHWLSRFENEEGDYAIRCCAKWAKANMVMNWTR